MKKQRPAIMFGLFCFFSIFILFLSGCAHPAGSEAPGSLASVTPESAPATSESASAPSTSAPPASASAMEKPMPSGFFPTDKYEPKINNFIVIIDASSSMGNPVNGVAKINLAKQFVEKMIRILPELNFNASLITYGHNPFVTLKRVLTRYASGPYDKTRFATALNNIQYTGGYGPLEAALNVADSEISTIHGDTALIMISDSSGPESLAVKTLKAMKTKYKTALCVYPVLIGNDPAGIGAMNDLAWIGKCGFAVKASNMDTDAAMADYVENVFLSRVVYTDTDGDGVYDRFDQCAKTPWGVVVDKRGCWVVDDIAYGFDKWHIRPAYYPVLDGMVRVFAANPELKVEIQGYTDNVGTTAYNLTLSEKRANSVMDYLIAKGVARDRMYVIGYGAKKPVADNSTAEGRAINRRVELKPVYLVPAGR